MDLNLGATPLILRECRDFGCTRNQTAYILATAYWETARTMEPVREAFWLTEDWRRKNLRYYPWYGRGFVQLTWEANYKKAGEKLGRDFLSDPDAVMDAGASAAILVRGMMEAWFTGKALPAYVNAQASDYRQARRVVNGMDKADEIAALARAYETDLHDWGAAPVQVANTRNPEAPARTSPAQSTTVQAGTVQAVTAVSGGVSAVAALDGTAQIVALVVCGVVLLAAVWIMRERIKKFAEGVR
jgi:hypothetical protein